MSKKYKKDKSYSLILIVKPYSDLMVKMIKNFIYVKPY